MLRRLWSRLPELIKNDTAHFFVDPFDWYIKRVLPFNLRVMVFSLILAFGLIISLSTIEFIYSLLK